MKFKLFLSVLMLMFGTLTATYASFPVQRTTTNNSSSTVVVENQEDELSSPAVVYFAEKSQAIALILALTLGLLAAHRWYLGNIWVWNIFFIFTFGGLGIWLIYDIVQIIRGKAPKGRLKRDLF